MEFNPEPDDTDEDPSWTYEDEAGDDDDLCNCGDWHCNRDLFDPSDEDN